MIGQALASRRQRRDRRVSASLPCHRRGLSPADRGIGILAQRGGKRALITRLGLQAGDRRAAAMFERAGQRVMLGLRCRQAPRAPKRAGFRPHRARSAAAARPCSASTRRASASASACVGRLGFGLGLVARAHLVAAVAKRLQAAPRASPLLLGARELRAGRFQRRFGDTRRSARIAACRASSSASAASASRDDASAALSSAAIRAECGFRSPRAAARSSRAPARAGRSLRPASPLQRFLARDVAGSEASSRSSSASRRATVSRRARAAASWCASS